MSDREPVLTLEDVAARLRVSVRTVQRRIAETGLQFAKPGRAFVFSEADYQALFEAIRQGRSSSSPPAPARATNSGSPGSPSMASAMRSLRSRQTKRRLAKLRKQQSETSARVVHLDLEKP